MQGSQSLFSSINVHVVVLSKVGVHNRDKIRTLLQSKKKCQLDVRMAGLHLVATIIAHYMKKRMATCRSGNRRNIRRTPPHTGIGDFVGMRTEQTIQKQVADSNVISALRLHFLLLFPAFDDCATGCKKPVDSKYLGPKAPNETNAVEAEVETKRTKEKKTTL